MFNQMQVLPKEVKLGIIMNLGLFLLLKKIVTLDSLNGGCLHSLLE